MLPYKLFQTSPRRFGYELRDGSKVGMGFTSQRAAEDAAKQAIEQRNAKAADTKQGDAFAGLEWLGV